jgi:hypothetical protein
MRIRDRINAAGAAAGRAMDKLIWPQETGRAEALRAEGERLRAQYGEYGFDAAGRWVQLSSPSGAWAQMDEGQRTDYLGERAVELAHDDAGAEAVQERMDRDGVPDERRWEVNATAREWGEEPAQAGAAEYEPYGTQAERDYEEYWESQAPGADDPEGDDWDDTPRPDLDDATANALERELEAREMEAREDEAQRGGPLWNPETGQPYDEATQERMIADARAEQWASMADPALALSEREHDVGAGREAGQ